MIRFAATRTPLEPRGRRRLRLIQTMLAFPAAGAIGFGGHVVVRHALAPVPALSVPPAPADHRDEYKPHDTRGAESPDRVGRPRNA
jgi:hypothetical protein